MKGRGRDLASVFWSEVVVQRRAKKLSTTGVTVHQSFLLRDLVRL